MDEVDFKGKTVIGLVEEVSIISGNTHKKVIARIDTGATVSSIHTEIVKELGLGPAITIKKVKNANGIALRPIISVNMSLHGKEVSEKFSVSDRSHMKYKLLIGINVLKHNYLIDPNKNLPVVDNNG